MVKSDKKVYEQVNGEALDGVVTKNWVSSGEPDRNILNCEWSCC